MSATGRSGLLVMRVWIEEPPPRHLRVRVTHMSDVASGREEVTTASSIDDVCAFVRAWLEAFVLDGLDDPQRRP